MHLAYLLLLKLMNKSAMLKARRKKKVLFHQALNKV